VQAVQPLLEELGRGVRIVGSEADHANLVKLIGNFMVTVVVETLGEACATSAKARLDPAHLAELLTGTISAPAYRNYGASISAQRYQPAGFALPLAQKDNRLMLKASEALAAAAGEPCA
jgi:3-hydroxyisobutyrate dehydrogenase-like beta-hydroxyacid dehydrogenase